MLPSARSVAAHAVSWMEHHRHLDRRSIPSALTTPSRLIRPHNLGSYDLPMKGFFWLGPLLFLIVHAYVLLHFRGAPF